jgi:hypothetical protein
MSNLLRYLEEREAEIASQISALKVEQAEIRVARNAILAQSEQAAQSRNVIARAMSSTKLTHRQMIKVVLDDTPAGGTHERIIDLVRDRFGVEIQRSSISSHLSRLKSEENAVVLDPVTKIWRSVKHAGDSAFSRPANETGPSVEEGPVEEEATSSESPTQRPQDAQPEEGDDGLANHPVHTG